MNLKESILKSVKAGKYALIEEWCKNHDIDNFKINSSCEIEMSNKYPFIELFFNDYDELPDYINIANHQKLCINLESERANSIKSFRGFPKECGSVMIDGCNGTIPELKIRCNSGFRLIDVDITKPFEVEMCGEYRGMATLHHCNIKNLKNLKITNCNNIQIIFSPFFDKIAEKILNDSHINYNKGLDERHFSDSTCAPKKVKKVIEKFFSKFLDYDKLDMFKFSIVKDGIDRYYLVEKYKDEWYVFKTRF